MLELPGASDDLRELATRGVRRNYAKGRLLIEEGDEGHTLYIIFSGRLRAFSAANGRQVTYGQYGPGEYVGELSLDGGPRSASVETLASSDCAVVSRRTLEDFIVERPAFAFELLGKVIRRARAATLSARQMALNDVYGRLRYLLETSAQPAVDGRRRIPERLKHKDIAARIGCSPGMVSRLMTALQRGGYIEEDDGRWLIVRTIPHGW